MALSLLIISVVYGEIIESGSLSFSGMYRATYDDNILRYSQRDYDRARDGTETLKTPVKTLDDMRNDIRITAVYRFKLFNKRGRMQASVNYAYYIQNNINNAGWLSLTYKQGLAHDWNALINYFYEPYYFLRDYYDVHTNERKHCDFALLKFVGKLYYRPIKLCEFVTYSQFKRYAYNEYFTEYDGDRYELGGEGIIRTGAWRIALSYGFGWFNNFGFNSEDLLPPSDFGEDSETGDGNYEEDNYSLSVYYSFKLSGKRSRIKLRSSLVDRYYTTDRDVSLDPIHHARHDIVVTNAVSVEWRWMKQSNLEIGTTFYNRHSKASSPVVSNVKDYSRMISWLEVIYDFR